VTVVEHHLGLELRRLDEALWEILASVKR